MEWGKAAVLRSKFSAQLGQQIEWGAIVGDMVNYIQVVATLKRYVCIYDASVCVRLCMCASAQESPARSEQQVRAFAFSSSICGLLSRLLGCKWLPSAHALPAPLASQARQWRTLTVPLPVPETR